MYGIGHNSREMSARERCVLENEAKIERLNQQNSSVVMDAAQVIRERFVAWEDNVGLPSYVQVVQVFDAQGAPVVFRHGETAFTDLTQLAVDHETGRWLGVQRPILRPVVKLGEDSWFPGKVKRDGYTHYWHGVFADDANPEKLTHVSVENYYGFLRTYMEQQYGSANFGHAQKGPGANNWFVKRISV